MIGNLSKVQERLRVYAPAPDSRFNVKSGLSPEEEGVKEKIRQYWADGSIANVKKLEGLNIDLSGFDPRRTSNKQLRGIAVMLAEKGIIDGDLMGTFAAINVQFDDLGQEINIDAEVDAYAFFEKELAVLGEVIAEGNELAKGALVELKTSISVMMALEEYAKAPRDKSLVNIRA
jgi:hypothetical protein